MPVSYYKYHLLSLFLLNNSKKYKFYVTNVNVYSYSRHLKEDIASLDLKVIEMIAKMWQHSANYLVAIKELKITDLSEKESAYPIVMGNEVCYLILFPFRKVLQLRWVLD